VLLDVWGMAESPVAIWRRLMDFGFSAGAFSFTVGSILLGALVIYLAVLLSGLVASLLAPDEARPAVAGHPPFAEGDRGLAQSISKLAHYALVTLGVVVALAVMGVELQNFAIVAGALGIGVGFGLQNVVNNFASGLILLLERPVRVGDTVVVGDVWGTIRKIGLRSTVMLTLDQSEMIVPNADLVSEKVINWTLTSPIARIILPVGVAYGSPVDDVLKILEETAFAHDSVLRDPPPQALFVGFGDSALDFELRIWVQNIRLRLEVRSLVLQEVDRRFREAGIEIPFPQRDLHLRSVDGTAFARIRDPA
jgi:potassium-dependent mechanosensitive channel